MPADLVMAPDPIADAVDFVIDWLADECGGQAEFSIGEHWAPYPTAVCDARIDLAAEILSNAVDEGCGGDFAIPGVPVVTKEIMVSVFATIKARTDLIKQRRRDRIEAEARRAAQAESERADAEAQARKIAARARRAETFRRILDPANNASDAERMMAARFLGVPHAE